MSLSLVLNNALSGLNVNQRALAVLSQNIANANTTGYSKQLINQSAVYLDGIGSGVSLDAVARKVDEYLVKSIQLQSATVGKTNVVDDYNSRIQLLLGKPGDQNSVDSYITNFFSDLQTLAQTPQDATLQQTAVNSGITLANQIHQLAEALQQLQYQADQDINQTITNINTDLASIAGLNASVATNKVAGKSTADLEDRRDIVLNDLSQYLNITPYTKASGAIHLTTSNGVGLLDDNVYELTYTPVGSATAFSNGTTLSPISLYRVDGNGNRFGEAVQLVSSGTTGTVTSLLTGGKLAGLLQMRDEQLPHMIAQLDELASNLRDQMNAIHNAGTAFPGANSYTGTREVNGQEYTHWSGSVRIALLDSSGQPIPSPYGDEPNGVKPLTIDLGAMDVGGGAGNLSMQSIINEINNYYGVPPTKVELGNLNNIQLVSNNTAIPGSSQQFNFDFDLNNLSTTQSKFFVTGATVTDNLGATMTTTSTIPSVALASTGTYVTTAGSSTVTVTTAAAHGLQNGDVIYLSQPGAAVDGIPATSLGGYFTVSNVTSTSFDIETPFTASSGASTNVSGMTMLPPYQTAEPGEQKRTTGNGTFTTDISGNPAATYYDVTVQIGVLDAEGNISRSTVTYRVSNNQSNALNKRIGALSATGDANLISPTSNQPLLTASLVDADGRELPLFNGAYSPTQDGFLKITAANGSYTVAIDSLDSKEIGSPNASPPEAGTDRGFSYFFELNNFFHSNVPTSTGDTVANSALNMAVESRLQANPHLVSIGMLTQSSGTGNYTYERTAGDNSIAQRMADLGVGLVAFDAAGGLSPSTQTFTGYAAQIIGAAANNASTASNNKTNAQTLMDGFTQRSSSISGVNLDTELANTVIYQNAYSATARMITIVNTLFDTLLQSV